MIKQNFQYIFSNEPETKIHLKYAHKRSHLWQHFEKIKISKSSIII
jgi:hypothetical protein